MSEDYIGAAEFSRFVDVVQRQMKDGFDRTSREIGEVKRELAHRVNTLDHVVQEHGEELAVLLDRSKQTSNQTKRTASGWGGGVGAFVAAALVAAYKYLSGGQ